MTLNDTPSGERTHIGFFGMRNAGKSSVVNAVCSQRLSVVSDHAGTTTDPVRKAMELLPLGPVLVIDTPGIDDVGALGALRVEKTKQVLRSCDIAVLIVDGTVGMREPDKQLVALFEQRQIPYLVAWNKADVLDDAAISRLVASIDGTSIAVSALAGEGINDLKEAMAAATRGRTTEKRLVADLLTPGDSVVLVVPIDGSAPKGRIILPQQMVLRDVLDAQCAAYVCQPSELAQVLENLAVPPRMVVTDSQAFGKVSAIVPEDVLLTSFSILMARYKGQLEAYAAGAAALGTLKDGDVVLISEGCTHHRQCEDIGTVKLPRWISEFSGADLAFEFTSGREFPDDVSAYALVVHCGACMLNEREVGHRLSQCKRQGTPVLNYGMAIAHVNGILARSLEPFMAIQAADEKGDADGE